MFWITYIQNISQEPMIFCQPERASSHPRILPLSEGLVRRRKEMFDEQLLLVFSQRIHTPTHKVAVIILNIDEKVRPQGIK